MRLQALALVKSTTSASDTSLYHQATNSLKDTPPVRAMSNSFARSAVSRSIPSHRRASCSSVESTRPPASTSSLSKTARNWGSDKECSAWSPLNRLLRDRKTCWVDSSTRAQSATPRMMEPSLGSTTWTLEATASLVRFKKGGSASVKPLIPAVRPVGMTMILSTLATAPTMVLMCPSTLVAHSAKSGVPGCGGVNLLPTIQPEIAPCHSEVKRAFRGEFRTRLPSLKSTAPMCLPKVQMSTSWPLHMSSPALLPKVSSS
mmetsp:Transcript_13609/g.37440  ORF Transcript_13609/g.37440 Transcript_13609/m.37440 type:complete len:260 (-) Transcript_13609:531-1310(-)